ncbi:MAG: ABC transporter permease [Theionarchaea archaeon]|nr:ABC transporter permease [Theionarchaea archaeon]
MLRKLYVFVKRDFLMLFTYKFAMVFNYVQMIMNLFLFVLFAGMFGERMLVMLEPYGGDFIQYILVGSIGWGYLWSAMGAASGSIQQEMMRGTFEPIFLTPTSPFVIVIAYTIWGLIMGTISLLIHLAIGFFVFNVQLTGNVVLAIVMMGLSVLMMIGFGLMVAGLNVFLKQIGAMVSVVQSVSLFLCGVYFPLSVLPEIIQPLGKILPFYYSIMGLRLSLSETSSLSDIMPYIWIISVLAIISLFFGAFLFKQGLNRARKEGTLAYY